MIIGPDCLRVKLGFLVMSLYHFFSLFREYVEEGDYGNVTGRFVYHGLSSKDIQNKNGCVLKDLF